ncbi:MAG: sporulation transcriptional regulator SpoIIID [Firmicutes bacterium]|nr:sporulation transcriptional regulator SpoIIID [Bacillota bacterium]
MKDYIEERVMELAQYILSNESTVRKAAKKYNISKSTVHKDITERLEDLNPSLAAQVHIVLDKNKAERHIRGGLATKEKYLKISENRRNC